ncbi:hypothetical protein [Nocardioides sp. 503]|uniref:hypothetical protein n=1 Tax=Nocardioides sp. 503 TaxID=2508326 RepID=UPI00106F12F0|nr:hypothetical protein [Nocardioides sp. 503]
MQRTPSPRQHHPWRVFSTLTEWKLEWTDDLPAGTLGRTEFDAKRVLLANGMDQAERRCTIAHETQHILRGPYPAHRRLYEELTIDRKVSRLLIPSVRKIGHALAFHRADVEQAADELWVDEPILNVRLSSLAPRERAYMAEQMATILV